MLSQLIHAVHGSLHVTMAAAYQPHTDVIFGITVVIIQMRETVVCSEF